MSVNNEKMLVGAVREIGQAELAEVCKPVVGKDEVLVKMGACALCTLEQRSFTGAKKFPYPYVGGHEIAGYVCEVGAEVSDKWKVGEKVALKTITECHECHYCHIGQDTMCDKIGKDKRQIPEMEGIGGLAQYFLAKPSMLFKIKEEVDIEVASLSEPLSCVLHSIDRANIDFGEDVVVVGAGIMGMLHLQLAKMRGARVIMVEPDDNRLQEALKCGADSVINPKQSDLVEEIKKLTDGRGVDVIFYTPAISKLVEEYLKICAKNARLVLYGSFTPDTPIDLSLNYVHYNHISIIGVVNPGERDFARATKLINTGLINLKRYVNQVIPFEEIQRAFTEATCGKYYRVVVKFK